MLIMKGISSLSICIILTVVQIEGYGAWRIPADKVDHKTFNQTNFDAVRRWHDAYNRSSFRSMDFLHIFDRLASAYGEHSAQRRCEEIKVPMCKKIGYNMTAMPNQFNHINQAEAETEANQFEPLLKTNCSPDLLFFLCSLYTPICIPDYHQSLPPCRAVCYRVRSGCEPVMKRHGFDWPQSLNCNRVTGQSEQLCMDSNPKTTTTQGPVTRTHRSRARERSHPAELQKDGQSNYVSVYTETNGSVMVNKSFTVFMATIIALMLAII